MGDREKTKYVILGMLALGKCTGYDIKKFIGETIAHFWIISYGQIYPILKQLVIDGFAVMETQVQRGKPNRNVYTITEQGVKTFQEWLKAPAEFVGPGNETLVKLFFGAFGDIPARIRDVERYMELVNEKYQQYLAIEKELERQVGRSPHIPFWLVTLRTGILEGQITLQWCNETLTKLHDMGSSEGKKKRKER
ncbi:MAG: PadR family transcriptional regulator [Fidelibacterota bacterium]|nr:MAG: PadR family transcriptional regulator [Candidatus Neomarinimicrobiota bacterium]